MLKSMAFILPPSYFILPKTRTLAAGDTDLPLQSSVCHLAEVTLYLVELFEQLRGLRRRGGRELFAQRGERLLEVGLLVRGDFVDVIASAYVFDHGLEDFGQRVERGVGVSAARVELQVLAVCRGRVEERAAQVVLALAGQRRLRRGPSDALGDGEVCVLLLQ